MKEGGLPLFFCAFSFPTKTMTAWLMNGRWTMDWTRKILMMADW